MKRESMRSGRLPAAFAAAGVLLSVCAASGADPAQEAKQILAATGVQGGLVVHLGCGDGRLTAALRAGPSYLVHGLDADADRVAKARRHVRSLGLYGPVSVDQLRGKRLPYIEHLVNLVVSADLGDVPMDEVMRVLAPNGVAYVKSGAAWAKTVKPRPGQIDEWTHYLHDATNNAVAHDTVVGPPRRMQWIGGPRWGRHHDRMSSVSAAVSAGGRVFAIIDEATKASILIAPQWTLVARDAFNGTVLWKRPIATWHTHLWPLKSGPAQLPRRLVAAGDRVYATLGLDAPLTALDAATGQTVRIYDGTKAAEEVLHSDGVLFVLVNDAAEKPDYDGRGRFGRGYGATYWDEAPRQVMAVRADSGKVLWRKRTRVLPATLAADAAHVYFHDGDKVVCLDRASGRQVWASEPIARAEKILAFYVPILVVYDDVVLFSGGETAGKQTGSWYMSGKDTMTALSAETGKVLWTAYHPPSGYRSPEDLLVVDGLVWTGETTSGRAVGVFTGRDPHTGEVKREFPPDVQTYWFHHRCHRGKATDKYLLMSRTGVEFIDVRAKHWMPHHWVRGACLYGVMPANGLLYNPPHPCACYLDAKLNGFNALAPASAGPRIVKGAASEARLVKGPAYDAEVSNLKSQISERKSEIPDGADWPTYRHDAARSGRAGGPVPAAVKQAWAAELGGRLTSPVVAAGKVFVASVDAHTVHALDAATGRPLWQYTAGGRVDSPPTVYRGRVLFGSADGWVHALRAADGVPAWRFRAAPMDERLVSYGQVESVWPLHGSVLVQDGVAYCVAGRSMFLDGGLRLVRLEVQTGRLVSETVLDDRERGTGKDLQSWVSWLNMPPALPDVLSSDGRLVYMRAQPFNLDGTRLPLKAIPKGTDADRGAPPATQTWAHAHLFCPTGFLDDSWWHRTYWVYGSTFVSGWCGYFLAGKAAPAGRILVFDDSRVYGFGRKPQYYRWTTPIEHHLFATGKTTPIAGRTGSGPAASLIRVAKSESLNPAGKPLTVEAWVKAERPGGVVLARGGGNHGYVLYLEGGRPHFAVRIKGQIGSVAATEKVAGRWVHLAGVLTAEKGLQVFVDGALAASGAAPGLVAEDPQEAMEIGADDSSTVADYTGPFAFSGLIDEVRVYHRALAAAEIAKHAAGAGSAAAGETALALAYTFDKPGVKDLSGNKNHGKVEGARRVAGKVGKAMQFGAKAEAPPAEQWYTDVPLLARGMVLAGETLFIAGPPDLVDEPQAMKTMNDPKVAAALADQAAAFAGAKGALLWAVSAASGERVAEYTLEAPPVFDGLIAAGGRLYLSTTDGKVLCLAGE